MPLQVDAVIFNMPKDATIDLLDEFRGAGCYADYSIEELHEILLHEYKRKNIGRAEILDMFIATN